MTRFRSLVGKSLVTLLIGSAALATNLHAQSDDAITIRIPFSFTVGTQNLAPGTYEFSLPSSQFMLSVINVKTGAMEMFNVRPEGQRAIAQYGSVVFRNSEESSSLNEIHFPGTGIFSEVIQRRGGGRMEAKKSPPENSISIAER
ncbi:MAG TPA: hypothetical protein VGL82_23030 [Bryobacteraceae bacterium]|jgi:hypothetical protein